MKQQLFWFLFGGIWLLVGSGFLVGGAVAYRQEQQYRAEGHVAEGIVLTKSVERARRDGHTSTSYHVRYRFATADGRTFEGSDSVGVETWEALEERGPVRVRYLPASPGSNRVEQESDEWLAFVFMGAGAVFAPIGGLVFLKGWRQYRTRRRLLSSGMPAEATVTEVALTRIHVNGIWQWRIHYRYQDHMAQTHEGQSGLLSPEEAEAWRAGDTGQVRFDRERPEESIWVGRPDGGPI